MEEKPTYLELLTDLWEDVNRDSKQLRPVVYLDQPPGPGWCFWDETWAYAYGPFSSEEEAQVEFKRYAETIGHIVGNP